MSESKRIQIPFRPIIKAPQSFNEFLGGQKYFYIDIKKKRGDNDKRIIDIVNQVISQYDYIIKARLHDILEDSDDK